MYLLSFIAVGRAASLKRRAARLSGVLLLLFAGGVLLDAGRRWWTGAEPVGWSMMAMALIAAAVNITCLIASPCCEQRRCEPARGADL